jgi:hypothetical protein
MSNEKKTTRGVTDNFREILEYLMASSYRLAFELIGLSYNHGTITGYFVNRAELKYVHIWEVKISPDYKYIYSDTWREIMLVPIDGCQFRRDVVLIKKADELKKLGFNIPDHDGIVPLRLEDAEWRYLWAVKENLKDHMGAAAYFITNPDQYNDDLGLEVFKAYNQALEDLQEALGDYEEE